MTDIVHRLRQLGEWTEPKVWEHHPTAWEAADEIERLQTERTEACSYLERLLLSFTAQHFPDNKVFEPLHNDLLGMLTQIDNASTIARDYRDEIERLRADSGEPAAWRCVAEDGVSDLTEDEEVAKQWRSDGFAVTPLYVVALMEKADVD